MPPSQRQPLIEYLGVQRQADAELNRVLAQAARDAEQRVLALELAPPGIGNRVRQAQLLQVIAAIRELQEQLWVQGIGPLIVRRLAAAQRAAMRAAEFMDDVLFASLPRQQAELLRDAARQMANSGLVTEAHRREVNLSARVWRNASLSSGALERTIRAGIIQGLSARELAGTVRSMVSPSTRGGVSYAAMRLARTELNNAFHERQIAVARNKPWVVGVQWNLSKSHPKKDKCDEYATENAHDLGRGVFPTGGVPFKPHPHCLCYMTYEMQSEDDFVADLRQYIRTGRQLPSERGTA